jgi:hypothetical protein
MMFSRPSAIIGSSLLLMLNGVHVRGFAAMEPFLGAWCAELFPLYLVDYNGFSMARINQKHITLEPYLGQWCFAQFPTELADVNQTLAVAALYDHHVQFEPFLQDWADQSTGNLYTPAIDLEPFVGQWCTLTFSQQLGRLQANVFRQVAQSHADLEPILVNWCFEQFAPEFTEPVTADDLDYTYMPVEDQLIGWSLTLLEQQRKHSWSPQSSSDQDAIIIGLSIALAITVLALICTCTCRATRRLCAQVSDATTANHNNRSNKDLFDSESFEDHDLSMEQQVVSQPVHA